MLRPDAERWLAELMVVRDRLKVMRANISADLFQQWFEAGPALAPARRMALLCGHPRSGTTLLEQVLDSHPDMVSAEETEIFHDYAYIPLMQASAGRRAHAAGSGSGGHRRAAAFARQLFPPDGIVPGPADSGPVAD